MKSFECRRCQELNTNVSKSCKRNSFARITISSQICGRLQDNIQDSLIMRRSYLFVVLDSGYEIYKSLVNISRDWTRSYIWCRLSLLVQLRILFSNYLSFAGTDSPPPLIRNISMITPITIVSFITPPTNSIQPKT